RPDGTAPPARADRPARPHRSGSFYGFARQPFRSGPDPVSTQGQAPFARSRLARPPRAFVGLSASRKTANPSAQVVPFGGCPCKQTGPDPGSATPAPAGHARDGRGGGPPGRRGAPTKRASLEPVEMPERGELLLADELLAEAVDEELWTEEGGDDHAGWFCVRTDPFPCPASGCTFVAEFMTAAHLI